MEGKSDKVEVSVSCNRLVLIWRLSGLLVKCTCLWLKREKWLGLFGFTVLGDVISEYVEYMVKKYE